MPRDDDQSLGDRTDILRKAVEQPDDSSDLSSLGDRGYVRAVVRWVRDTQSLGDQSTFGLMLAEMTSRSMDGMEDG